MIKELFLTKSGFDEERMQFFIIVGSIRPLESAMVRQIELLVKGAGGINNGTVYKTSDGLVRAVIGGQLADFRKIYSCLQSMTEELEDSLPEGATAETWLVASCNKSESTIFDFDRLEVDRDFKKKFPAASQLPATQQRRLQLAYLDIYDKLPLDRNQIFDALIRAKASRSTEHLGKVEMFFASLEVLLKQKMVPFLASVYGDEWRRALDQIKSMESIAAKNYRAIKLGGVFKIYRRVILEKGIIDIAPLSEFKFSKLMDDVVEQRNKLARHRPDLGQWDEMFSILSSFIPIHERLVRHLERLG
jgi:hypothetical protein